MYEYLQKLYSLNINDQDCINKLTHINNKYRNRVHYDHLYELKILDNLIEKNININIHNKIRDYIIDKLNLLTSACRNFTYFNDTYKKITLNIDYIRYWYSMCNITTPNLLTQIKDIVNKYENDYNLQTIIVCLYEIIDYIKIM